MARIDLRNCTIYLKDGLSGTAAINEPSTPPVATDTSFAIDTIVLNTADTDLVPIGARFTVAGETASTVHTVTTRTPTSTSPTTEITFTPALGAGTYADGGVVTFQPQQIEIKIGEALRAIRKRNRLTLLEMSALSGVQSATLSRMENNKTTGRLDNYIAIANALGLRLSELFAETERNQND